MSSSWKIVLIIVSSVIILAAGFFGYQYYLKYNQPHAKAVQAINPDCAMFANIHDPRSWLSGLVQEKDWWQTLLDIPLVQSADDHLLHIDSIVSTDTWFTEVLELQQSYVVIDKISDTKFSFVFLIELPSGHGKTGIEKMIQRLYGKNTMLDEHSYKDVIITGFSIPGSKKKFYYSVYKSLFIGGFYSELIQRSIDQVNADVPVNFDESFNKIEATAGKNVDANIYLNHSSFSQLIAMLAVKKKSSFVQELANLGFWTETDLIIKNDEILLNGYTINTDSINILEGYKTPPQSVTIPDVLPYNTAWMLNLGVRNFAEYYYKCKDSNSEKSNEKKQSLVKFSIDLKRDVFSWIGPEISIAAFGKNSAEKNNQVAVFRTADVLKANIVLDELSKRVNRKNGKQEFRLKHGEYTIKKLNIPEFLPLLMGPVFSNIRQNYYLPIRDFVIFANNPEMLTFIIDSYYNHKTLSENINYQSFSNNISDNSNIYLYINTRRTVEVANTFLNGKYLNPLLQHKSVFQKFEGLAIQFSYINKMFYTNIYLKYNPGYQEVNPTNWEFELDANISQKPCLIQNHRNGKQNIIVFDENSNMYLLDHLGQLKWKLPLIENPISDIFLVDYYKNGKFQYLFNTENYLYLVDLNGNYVADFPVKLVASATSPINVFDYSNNQDYRIVLSLNDNKVYNYKIKGEAVEGWKKIQSRAAVRSKVEHLVVNKKDYLFTTDENGNVTITNRKGEVRVEMKKGFKKSANARFYANETNKKGLFITTNEKGELVYISSKGKIQRTSFGDFSPDHYFLYEDFDQNGSKDFIYMDGNKLVVFDRFKKPLLEQEFEEQITLPLVIYKHMGQIYLGIVLSDKQEIRIFNKNGRVYSEEVIKSSLPFVSGSLNADNKLNIIAGLNNKVMGYLMDE